MEEDICPAQYGNWRKLHQLWLRDLSDLSEECLETKIAEFLGETLKIENEEFTTENSILTIVASMFRL